MRFRSLVAAGLALAAATPGYAQPAPPSPPAFSVIAPVSATLAVTTATGRVQLPNSTTRYPSVLIVNDGTVEMFVSVGGATVTAAACPSTSGTCNSIPVPAGQSISGFAGAGYVAAITTSVTSVMRVVQFNGSPWFGVGGAGTGTVGSASFAVNQVSVGTTATLIAAARTGPPGTGRISITIEQLGTTVVYLGGSGVLVGTGIPLQGTAGASITLPTTGAVYGIVGTGSQPVAFVETF